MRNWLQCTATRPGEHHCAGLPPTHLSTTQISPVTPSHSTLGQPSVCDPQPTQMSRRPPKVSRRTTPRSSSSPRSPKSSAKVCCSQPFSRRPAPRPLSCCSSTPASSFRCAHPKRASRFAAAGKHSRNDHLSRIGDRRAASRPLGCPPAAPHRPPTRRRRRRRSATCRLQAHHHGGGGGGGGLTAQRGAAPDRHRVVGGAAESGGGAGQ